MIRTFMDLLLRTAVVMVLVVASLVFPVTVVAVRRWN